MCLDDFQPPNDKELLKLFGYVVGISVDQKAYQEMKEFLESKFKEIRIIFPTIHDASELAQNLITIQWD
jgi:hypothetical protein